MKKFLSILLFLIIFLTGCNNQNNNSYNVYRTATKSNNESNEIYNNVNQTTENNINTETELSSFSTKIYTPDDEARQNNIRITCSKLNGVIVKVGETFSFCNTVGKATPEAGYKKADVFDKNGNTIKGYGRR